MKDIINNPNFIRATYVGQLYPKQVLSYGQTGYVWKASVDERNQTHSLNGICFFPDGLDGQCHLLLPYEIYLPEENRYLAHQEGAWLPHMYGKIFRAENGAFNPFSNYVSRREKTTV